MITHQNEPKSERPVTPNPAQPQRCLNCGHELTGRFCARCGQEDRDINIPFRQLVADFFGDLFSFDSRLIRTLKPLLFKPGFLTREYLTGKRVRYVPPVRLYVFISFIFFLLVAVTDLRILDVQVSPEELDRLSQEVHQRATGPAPSSTDSTAFAVTEGRLPMAEALKRQFLHNLRTISQDPQRLNAMLLNQLPKLMFFLMPLFAALLRILYRKQAVYYIQHLTFALHYHAFAFLLFSMFIGLYLAGAKVLIFPLALTLPIYLFIAMRRVYPQPVLRTLLKWLVLMASYGFLLALSLMITTALVILFYS